jgi:hypothetical protein
MAVEDPVVPPVDPAASPAAIAAIRRAISWGTGCERPHPGMRSHLSAPSFFAVRWDRLSSSAPLPNRGFPLTAEKLDSLSLERQIPTREAGAAIRFWETLLCKRRGGRDSTGADAPGIDPRAARAPIPTASGGERYKIARRTVAIRTVHKRAVLKRAVLPRQRKATE